MKNMGLQNILSQCGSLRITRIPRIPRIQQNRLRDTEIPLAKFEWELADLKPTAYGIAMHKLTLAAEFELEFVDLQGLDSGLKS